MKIKTKLLIPLLYLTGCVVEDDMGVTSSTSVADSSGVQIVDVPGSLLDDLPTLRVGGEAAVTIGRADGRSAYLFGRVSGATRLESGTVAVLDGQALVVRLFDSEGQFLRELGGRGRGPSEFQRPTILRSTGNGGFVVYDRALSKLVVFNTADGFVETIPLPLTRCPRHRAQDQSARCEVRGVLADLSIGTVAYGPRRPGNPL